VNHSAEFYVITVTNPIKAASSNKKPSHLGRVSASVATEDPGSHYNEVFTPHLTGYATPSIDCFLLVVIRWSCDHKWMLMCKPVHSATGVNHAKYECRTMVI